MTNISFLKSISAKLSISSFYLSKICDGIIIPFEFPILTIFNVVFINIHSADLIFLFLKIISLIP